MVPGGGEEGGLTKIRWNLDTQNSFLFFSLRIRRELQTELDCVLKLIRSHKTSVFHSFSARNL